MGIVYFSCLFFVFVVVGFFIFFNLFNTKFNFLLNYLSFVFYFIIYFLWNIFLFFSYGVLVFTLFDF